MSQEFTAPETSAIEIEGSGSLSVMVMTPVPSEMVEFTGELRLILKVSFVSSSVSSVIGIVRTFQKHLGPENRIWITFICTDIHPVHDDPRISGKIGIRQG